MPTLLIHRVPGTCPLLAPRSRQPPPPRALTPSPRGEVAGVLPRLLPRRGRHLLEPPPHASLRGQHQHLEHRRLRLPEAARAKPSRRRPCGCTGPRRDGTEEWLDEHPLMALLADPHPSLSQPELDFWLILCLHTAGNAYLRKIRNRAGQVVQLWPVSPTTMSPETTEADRQRGCSSPTTCWTTARARARSWPRRTSSTSAWGWTTPTTAWGCPPCGACCGRSPQTRRPPASSRTC